MSKRTIEIDLPDEMWGHIDRLVAAWAKDYQFKPDDDRLAAFLGNLLDHVQQGVYRSGAWERSWLEQCVSPEAIEAAYAVGDDPAFLGGHIDRDGNLERQ